MHAPTSTTWPSLAFREWQDTFETLHLWTQIVGKTRLALAPMENHWWQVALYVTSRGLTTSAIPHDTRTFVVNFDFIDHQLTIQASDGAVGLLPLVPRSVADFYATYTTLLYSMDLATKIWPHPVEMEVAIPFPEDRRHASYDPDAAHRCWQVLVQADRLMKQFRGRFIGKASPVHFFWGSFDMAATRFSGRRAPLHPGGAPNCPDYVMVEAYSRECSSCGFWPGNTLLPEPAFYAYAYPTPDGFREYAVPAGSYYNDTLGEFILPYDIVRAAEAPDELVLDFFQRTYEAAAERAHWNRAELERS